ncbi:hypothetical protein ABPG74_018924 [Tetrahymena malaccensis]
MSSTLNLSTLNQLSQKDLDSNQKSDLEISPVIIKEQEKKNIDTLNEENSQEIKQLQKEDIEGIQDKKNYQSNEREFAQITKNHQTSQMIEEESKNQILNQENLSNAKKDREDQNIPIPLHSDLTLKKKIQSYLNRNLAKIGLSQNASFQVLHINGTQNAIITYKKEEEEICLTYQSAASNSKDASKEQIISNQNSQTKTFRKGQQNIPCLMKNEGNSYNYEIIQKQDLSNIPQPSNSLQKQQQDQNKKKLLDIEKQLAITYASQIEKIINQIKEFKINGNDLDQSKVENINESQIENLDSNQKQEQKSSPNMIKEWEQEKKIFDIPNNQSTIYTKDLSKDILKILSSDNVVKEQEMKIFVILNNKSFLNIKDISKQDIKDIQNQEKKQSSQSSQKFFSIQKMEYIIEIQAIKTMLDNHHYKQSLELVDELKKFIIKKKKNTISEKGSIGIEAYPSKFAQNALSYITQLNNYTKTFTSKIINKILILKKIVLEQFQLGDMIEKNSQEMSTDYQRSIQKNQNLPVYQRILDVKYILQQLTKKIWNLTFKLNKSQTNKQSHLNH